jgi:two-component system sensor histidine kinase BaeS
VDRRWLHQVVANLLANAVKFTPSGGQITLAVDRQGQSARLVVSDTGVGIPARELPHVFERFWRGQAASATRGSGTGLAVVAELVAAHRGQVTAASEADHGTTITVTVPIATLA